MPTGPVPTPRIAGLFAVIACLGLAGPAAAAEQRAFAAGLTYLTPVVVASVGDSLTFTNLDVTRHDVVGDGGAFRSAVAGFNESVPVVGVEELGPGTYGFSCSLHSWMTGVLQVNEAAGAPTPPALPPVPAPPDGDEPVDPMTLVPKVDPPAALGPSEWPSYGRDLANSRDGGADAPTALEAARLGAVWSHRSDDGDYTGTPVVADGTLVAGSSGGTVVALDARTGAERWRRDFDKPINASAAIAGDTVYVPLVVPGAPSVAALDLTDGTVRWEQVIDSQPTADTYGSPRVWDGKVFMGTSGYFGEQLSEADVQARGSVVALDAATGARLWKTWTVPEGQDGGAVWSTPAVDPDSGHLYVGTGNAYHEPAGEMTDSILRLDADTGVVVDHFQATAGDVWNGAEDWPENPDADFGSSPNLFTAPDGTPVVGAGQKSGDYWALDRRSLDVKWRTTTGPGHFTGGIIGSTAVDGGAIYGPNTQLGEVWSAGLGGALRWVSSDATPLHFSAVSTANGVVYNTDLGGFLNVRDAATGAVLSKVPLGAPSWGGVAIAGGMVFAVTGTGGTSGYVAAYRPR